MIQDFQTSKCSNLVCIPFALSWSDDNMVAMATEKGIYLWEINYSPYNKSCSINAKRYHLLPTSDMVNPVIDFKSDHMNNNTLHQWMHEISSFSNINSNSSPPSIKQFAWSPCIDKFSSRSFLILLLDCGSLSMYKLGHRAWIQIASISKQWLQNCVNNWKEKSRVTIIKNSVSEMAERAHKIKISAFVWVNISCEKKNIYSCLVTSNMSGDIAVWSIRPSSKNTGVEIDLIRIVATELGHITSLWFQKTDKSCGVLMLSASDGRIHCMLISINFDGTITTGRLFPVWNDKDRISVSPNGAISLIQNDKIILIVGKGCHILVFQLDLGGQTLQKVAVLESGGAAITGFAKFSESRIMFTTRFGNLLMLNVGENDALCAPKVMKLRSSLRSEHYACYGIGLSKSKVMTAIVYSVCKNYDHLAVRGPSHVTWCLLSGFSTSTDIITNHTESISDIWDALDVFRIECIQKNQQGYTFPSLKDLDVMDIRELKKNLWLTKMSCLINNNGGSLDENKKISDQITMLVISCHIFKKITNFLLPIELSEFKRHTLFLMMKWLEYVLKVLDPQFEITRGTASTLLKQFEGLDLKFTEELCAICSSKVQELTGPNTSQCSENHTVPRCSLSLVQCNVLPYYFCPNCQAIAHPEAVTEGDCTCIYCDAHLKIDDNVLITDS